MSDAKQESTSVVKAPTFQEFTGMAGGRPELYHSLDLSKPQGKADLLGAINGDCASLSETKQEVIPVRDIVLQRVLIRPAEGPKDQLIEACRTVLISTSGERFQAVAAGVDSSVRALINIYGAPPWQPPLQIMPKTRRTRGGFKTLILDIAPAKDGRGK